MIGPSRKEQGDLSEQRALRHLETRGLRLHSRNYRCRGGELDLVMREGPATVFVEVRYRRGADFGTAAESVTSTKQRRLLLAARHFLQHHPELALTPCRFDVVAIGGDNEIDWIRDAFQADN